MDDYLSKTLSQDLDGGPKKPTPRREIGRFVALAALKLPSSTSI
ncbi:hypothetical protein WMF37_19070 [Sorangium sp. So ce291]